MINIDSFEDIQTILGVIVIIQILLFIIWLSAMFAIMEIRNQLKNSIIKNTELTVILLDKINDGIENLNNNHDNND